MKFKSLSMLVTGILFSSVTYAQQLDIADITRLTNIAKNEMSQQPVAIPITKRDSTDTSCDKYVETVGIATIETVLQKYTNDEGYKRNRKVEEYHINVLVSYDCDKYTITINNEDIVIDKKSMQRKESAIPSKTLILKEQDDKSYKIVNYEGRPLSPLTKKDILLIGNMSINMAEKWFEMSKDKMKRKESLFFKYIK